MSQSHLFILQVIHLSSFKTISLILNTSLPFLNHVFLTIVSSIRPKPNTLDLTTCLNYRYLALSVILKLTTATLYYSIFLLLTWRTLQTGHPSTLLSLLALTTNRSTRFSSLVTLYRPSNCSRLKITSRSFYYSAPALWNTLPPDLR